MHRITFLSGRAVLAVSGADRVGFLNGLVSNDVALAASGRAVWAALLTPQGKWLADFFILADADRLLLDCDATQAGLITQRLSRFRLRADAVIAPTGLSVHALWDTPDAPGQPLAAPDPRLPEAGWRILAPVPLVSTATAQDYDIHRLSLGLPDTADLEAEKTILLEAGFDELNGISWTKGCYMGQELTARTRYRGLLKRRLLPVRAASALPAHGTQITAGDRQVGEMRSSSGGNGLALIRIDAVGAALRAADIPLMLRIPGWMKLPEPVPGGNLHPAAATPI